MALQDLTPQLRTRLNRMERAVGWFIMTATLLLLAGLVYYIYKTAETRGWFKIKAQYFVYAERGDGLTVGSTVKIMGFPAGQIMDIVEMPPTWGQTSTNNVYIRFEVLEPHFGYIWTEGSVATIKPAGFLQERELDLTKGTAGYATYLTQIFRDNLTVADARQLLNLDKWTLGQDISNGTNVEIKAWQPVGKNLDKIAALIGTNQFCAIDNSTKKRSITAVWSEQKHAYEKFTGKNIYGLERVEEPSVTDRLQALVSQVQSALPGILKLTNELAVVLSNTTQLTSNLNIVAVSARPTVTNLAAISERLREPNGSLGQWLIPTNINEKLDLTLQSANGTLSNLDTNLLTLNLSLQNLANITSNLNNQVQANTNMLTRISDAVHHSDEFIQGLKRFWLFRHLFAAHKGQTSPAQPQPQQPRNQPLLSPRQKNEQRP
jgi:ABC-type transporter Mla subunit MlaD